MPLERGASGKVLLAYSDDDFGEAVTIRKNGFALSLGERDPEVAAVSVPVFARSGRLVGALSLSGLITRFETAKQDDFANALMQSSARLTKLISS